MVFTTRFAPSPTGRLHLGHAYSAYLAKARARERGGRFLVRIEDIDRERCRPEFEQGINEDLAWLDLRPDAPPERQSDGMQAYDDALARLRDLGLLYRCFRTRRETLEAMAGAPHGPVEAFTGAPEPPDREAALLEAGAPFAWRLSLSRAQARLGGFDVLSAVESGTPTGGEARRLPLDPRPAGDVVLARKGLGVAYHLAVVVDDARQGVTEVVRGEDLFAAVPVQRLLQRLLDLDEPTYHHHRLVLGPEGRRLAKRDHAQTLAALRSRGTTPEEIWRRLGLSDRSVGG